MLINLCSLADAPPEEVEQLLDAAFGSDRHQRTAYRIRKGMAPIPDLSFAAYEDQRLVGSLQCWPIALHAGGYETPLILVGPVAVDPDRQQRGIGRKMMETMLSRVEGREPLVLIGDPEYYGRLFDFAAEPTAAWELPGPFERRRLLARTHGQTLPRDGMLGPRQDTRSGETNGARLR